VFEGDGKNDKGMVEETRMVMMALMVVALWCTAGNLNNFGRLEEQVCIEFGGCQTVSAQQNNKGQRILFCR